MDNDSVTDESSVMENSSRNSIRVSSRCPRTWYISTDFYTRKKTKWTSLWEPLCHIDPRNRKEVKELPSSLIKVQHCWPQNNQVIFWPTWIKSKQRRKSKYPSEGGGGALDDAPAFTGQPDALVSDCVALTAGGVRVNKASVVAAQPIRSALRSDRSPREAINNLTGKKQSVARYKMHCVP